jgi:prepilin peptidase CpaA
VAWIAVLWVPLFLICLAAVFDVRQRTIPDSISVALLAWAVGATAAGFAELGWVDLTLGFGLGASLGVFLFWLGGLGGGDAKLLAALGASLGPLELLVLLFYVAVAGGIMAIVALTRGRRDLAYAPAMALGFLIFMIARGVQ